LRWQITCAATEANARLLAACPALKHYVATPWLPGPHLNTLWAGLARGSPHVTYQRVLLPLGDGGAVALDWSQMPCRGQPVVVLLHGLTGGSEERYIQWMVRACEERLGAACVVMNARGCSTSTLLTPQCFSAAWTHDIRCAVSYVRRVVGDAPVFAVGFSLGAGILAKFVAEDGDRCQLTAAVSCCASFDHRRSTQLLESTPIRQTYNAHLAGCLKRFFLRHAHQFAAAEWLDPARIAAARTIREFDAATIVPMFGFRDVWHYYDEATTAGRLQDVRIPMLLLNAADDPVCATAGLPLDAVAANPHLISVITREGGHVAWCTGWWPRGGGWDCTAVPQFLAAVAAARAGVAGCAVPPTGGGSGSALFGRVSGAGPGAVTRGQLPIVPSVVGWVPPVHVLVPSAGDGDGAQRGDGAGEGVFTIDADGEGAWGVPG
jgi:predicted alpha/beta-fold hydrolase